jgi:hypothetical protein
MNKFSKWLRGKVFNWLGVDAFVKHEIDTSIDNAIEKIRQDLTISFDYDDLIGIGGYRMIYARHTESIKNVVEMILDHLQLGLKYNDGTDAKISLEPLTQIISTSKEHAREVLKKRVNPETKKSKKG